VDTPPQRIRLLDPAALTPPRRFRRLVRFRTSLHRKTNPRNGPGRRQLQIAAMWRLHLYII